MKRCTFGFVLMGVLLVISVVIGARVDAFQAPLFRDLESSREAALNENWEEALALADSARNRWERSWKVLAASSDHGSMEELDSLYAQLEVAAQLRSRADFAALCAALSQGTKALADAHRASWWNVL